MTKLLDVFVEKVKPLLNLYPLLKLKGLFFRFNAVAGDFLVSFFLPPPEKVADDAECNIAKLKKSSKPFLSTFELFKVLVCICTNLCIKTWVLKAAYHYFIFILTYVDN